MPLFVGQQIDVFIDQAAMASTSIAVSQEGFPRDGLLPKKLEITSKKNVTEC
jgi:hypothetical protein